MGQFPEKKFTLIKPSKISEKLGPRGRKEVIHKQKESLQRSLKVKFRNRCRDCWWF